MFIILIALVAYVSAWHKPLLGSPLDLHVTPRFLGLHSLHVISAVDLHSGDLVWRHHLDHESIVKTQIAQSTLISLSTRNNNAYLRLWSLATGHLKSEILLPNLHVISFDARDANAITIVSATGITLVQNAKISWNVDFSLSEPQVYTDATKVYVLDSVSSTLHLAILDLSTGGLLSKTTMKENNVEKYLILNTGQVVLIWTSNGILKGATIKEGKAVGITNLSDISGITDISPESNDLITVSTPTETHLLQISATSDLKGKRIQKLGNKVFVYSLIQNNTETQPLVAEIANPHIPVIKISDKQIHLQYNFGEYGPVDTLKAIIHKDSLQFLVKSRDGSLLMFSKKGEKLWSRYDGLFDVKEKAIAFMPFSGEKKQVLAENESDPWKRYVKRSISHIESLGQFLQNSVDCVNSYLGLKDESSHSVGDDKSSNDTMVTDKFGIRKQLVLGTIHGTLLFFDTQTGDLLWRTYVGERIDRLNVHESTIDVLTTAHVFVYNSHGRLTSKEAIRGEARIANKKFVFWDKDAILGLSYLDKEAFFIDYKSGEDRIFGYRVQKSNKIERVWTLRFPQNEKILKVVSNTDQNVASLGTVLDTRQVLYKYLNPNTIAVVTNWRDEKNKIKLTVYMVDTVTGSILYKSTMYATGIKDLGEDSVQVLMCENWVLLTYFNWGPGYAPAQNASRERKEAAVPYTKSWELKILEMYQDSKPDVRHDAAPYFLFWGVFNDRGLSSSYANYKKPYVVEQAYVLPFPSVNGIGVTRTKAGVTTREILLLGKSSLYGILKTMVEPAIGTTAKTPSTLGFSVNNIISGATDLISKHAISSHTDLESTSVVCTFQGDLYCMTRMPSGMFDVLKEDFGRKMLISMVGGLAVAVYGVKKFGERKKLWSAWK